MNSLNRALLTGLVLEAMLENPRLKEEPGLGGRHLKASLRSSLASQLAGHMSLASFHSLVRGLEQWFEVVYPLLAGAGLAGQLPASVHPTSTVGFCTLREDLFSDCLDGTPGLLPRRRHRKLDRDKLQTFLEGTAGNWFCLRNFEEHFQIGRKTAWEYVQKLLQAGLLVHNHEHSSAVRYRVAPRFLKPGWSLSAGNAGPSGSGRSSPEEWRVPFIFKNYSESR